MKKIFRQTQVGFTLLELLIAISIFSILSVMAYSGLKTVLDSRDANQATAERVADIQLTIMRINNDLQHAVDRTVRDAFGARIASMMTLQTGDSSLEWTHSGFSNPGEFKRSNLQRVAYKLNENNLVRVTWPVLDRTQGTEPIESILISDIESLEWNFIDQSNAASSDWPTTAAFASNIITGLPKAVELTINFNDIGEIRRVILLP